MASLSSDHPQGGTSRATSTEQARHFLRPGWPEIVVGLVVLAIVGLGGGSQLGRLGLDPVVFGLVFTALSGVAGIAGFAAAALLRVRSWHAFGVRRTTGRWLLIGVGTGIVAFILKGVAIMVWMQITGDTANVQSMYGEGGRGGLLSLILATAFLSLLTPLGEELLFRGIVANVMLRYGPWIGVVGSAFVFALMHGINNVFPAALVVGLITGEVYRRSGSVWPGVVVHTVVNLPTVPLLVLASMA